MKTRARRWLKRILALCVTLVLLLVTLHGLVAWTVGSQIVTVENAPERTWAIVLGASVSRNGTPSNMLDDRLATVAELWAADRVRRVLVTGDRSVERAYDETAVMTAELVRRGVPRDAIEIDGRGYRTLDSMWRAARLFAIEDALIVTNDFHVPRSVWLARSFGIDATGVPARAGRRYSRRTRWSHLGREIAARVLAWCDVRLLDTQPAFTER